MTDVSSLKHESHKYIVGVSHISILFLLILVFTLPKHLRK